MDSEKSRKREEKVFMFITKYNRIYGDGFYGGMMMHPRRIRGEWVAVLIAASTLVSACGLSDSSALTVQGSGSVSATAIVVVEPPEESTQPTSRLSASDKESGLLTYMGSTAPIFTYNSENDILLAYCYDSGSAHLPYDLSSGLPVDGSEQPVYIPDLGVDAVVRFDVEYDIWRVFMSGSGSTQTESIVYIDDPLITGMAENLRREALPGSAPRYYAAESGIYYGYDGMTKEISVDLNGDGAAEKIIIDKTADRNDGTADYIVRIDGEEVAEILQAASMEGAFEADVYVNDDYKEIAFEYRDADNNPATLLMRYDGNSIRTAVFAARIDCAGNGNVLLRNEDGGTSSEKYIADRWFHFEILTEYSGLPEAEAGG